MQQLTNLQTVPNLDTPEYSVLKKTKVCRLTKCSAHNSLEWLLG